MLYNLVPLVREKYGEDGNNVTDSYYAVAVCVGFSMLCDIMITMRRRRKRRMYLCDALMYAHMYRCMYMCTKSTICTNPPTHNLATSKSHIPYPLHITQVVNKATCDTLGPDGKFTMKDLRNTSACTTGYRTASGWWAPLSAIAATNAIYPNSQRAGIAPDAQAMEAFFDNVCVCVFCVCFVCVFLGILYTPSQQSSSKHAPLHTMHQFTSHASSHHTPFRCVHQAWESTAPRQTKTATPLGGSPCAPHAATQQPVTSLTTTQGTRAPFAACLMAPAMWPLQNT